MEDKNKMRQRAIDLASRVKKDNSEWFDDKEESEAFLKISRAVLFDPILDSSEQRVFLVVTSLAQAYGVCFASQNNIGRLSDLKCRKYVLRVLQKLESKRFIKTARIDFQQKIYLIIPAHKRYPFLNDLDGSGERKKKDSFEYLSSEQYRNEVVTFWKGENQRIADNCHFLNEEIVERDGGDVAVTDKGMSPVDHIPLSPVDHMGMWSTGDIRDKEIKKENMKKEKEEDSRSAFGLAAPNFEFNVFSAREEKKTSEEGLRNEIKLPDASHNLNAIQSEQHLDEKENEMASNEQVMQIEQKAKEKTKAAHEKKLAKAEAKRSGIPPLKSGSQTIASETANKPSKPEQNTRAKSPTFDFFCFYKQQILEAKGYSFDYAVSKKDLGIIKRAIDKFGFDQLKEIVDWALKNWNTVVPTKDYRFKNLQPSLETILTHKNIEALLMIKAETQVKANETKSEFSKLSWDDISV